VAFAKFVALPTLLKGLKDRFGVSVQMSGSGSACFALLADDTPVEMIRALIRDGWGESAFVIETRIAEIPR
jgi:4-diphosphocytidyl-2-C-methyl-D-erythritol kinase